MSFFDKIFSDASTKDNHENPLRWNTLTEIKQLDELQSESHETPVLIFKHSTRCGISRMALKQFEKEYNLSEDDAKPYFLDLLAYRPISSEIADRFSVIHQSPQLLLIKNGKCVYDASHSGIDATILGHKIN
jgi:bacillithiol system protein YtxJ